MVKMMNKENIKTKLRLKNMIEKKLHKPITEHQLDVYLHLLYNYIHCIVDCVGNEDRVYVKVNYSENIHLEPNKAMAKIVPGKGIVAASYDQVEPNDLVLYDNAIGGYVKAVTILKDILQEDANRYYKYILDNIGHRVKFGRNRDDMCLHNEEKQLKESKWESDNCLIRWIEIDGTDDAVMIQNKNKTWEYAILKEEDFENMLNSIIKTSVYAKHRENMKIQKEKENDKNGCNCQ